MQWGLHFIIGLVCAAVFCLAAAGFVALIGVSPLLAILALIAAAAVYAVVRVWMDGDMFGGGAAIEYVFDEEGTAADSSSEVW